MTPITTEQAPAAIGPYSQAIVTNAMVYCSGQIPINPASGNIESEDIAAQTTQVLSNLRAVLTAAGSGLDKVVKTTIFLTDLNDFQIVNSIYAEAFGTHKPARSTVQVVRLPRAAKIEIEAIATL
jgi:2-iminobutanoate/2-iminopropanoate deaminase